MARSWKQAILIFHPGSGRANRLSQAIQKLTDSLCQNNWRITLRTLALDPKEMLDDELFSADLIIAAGGDGTVRTVLEAVTRAGLQTPVAIIPIGTGNLLARSLGLVTANESNRVRHAVDTILNGKATCIDLGKANGHYFTVDAGIGPLAEAIAAPSPNEKRRWKLLSYVWPLWKAVRCEPVHLKITSDCGIFERSARGLLITNAIDMGIGQGVDVHQMCDGTLDLCILNPQTYSDLIEIGLRFANWFFLGRASTHLPYEILQVRSAKIEVLQTAEKGLAPSEPNQSSVRAMGSKQVPMMLDGDINGLTPALIEVVPHAVNVMIPMDVYERTICRCSSAEQVR
ncbi:MAG: NAD(+)/NADH kinase [Candidatus Obscuribacterales bacterium]|nr:NAD(+)/NADH kinase [Candidatus Obscuribacterales bacterium]